jgi:hypothetical protein
MNAAVISSSEPPSAAHGFVSDNAAGVHPAVLEAVAAANSGPSSMPC